MLADLDWRLRGACGADPEVMWPHDRDVAGRCRAKQVCARCPVRADCLTDALAGDEPSGVAGGLSGRERSALRRRIAAGDTTAQEMAAASVPGLVPDAPRATRAGRVRVSTGRPRGWNNPTVADPSVLAAAGVTVASDGLVTIDDVSWLVARIVLQRHLDERVARQTHRGGIAPCWRWVRLEHRGLLCGVLHKLGHGVGWKAIPAAYGEPSRIRKLHHRLEVDGHWPDVLAALGGTTAVPAVALVAA